MTAKVIATRLEPAIVAKARDGLKAKGYSDEELATVANVVRLTFFYGLAELHADPSGKASDESMTWADQKINQSTKKKTATLKDLIK